MLEIRTFRSERNGIRVHLHRKYRHTDRATGKVKFSYKQLGSFLLSKGYSSELIASLQPDEVVALQNWLAEARFAEQFEVEADALIKISLHVPPAFYVALATLYAEAKRLKIDFIPHQVMLDSLLHKAKLLQAKIDKINGFPSNILEKVGIQTVQALSNQQKKDLLDSECQILFKTLLSLDQSVGKTCHELEKAANRYGKIKRISPKHLHEWASDEPYRNPNKRIKKWCFAIAIDVLHQHSINPITLVRPEKIATYWAIQRQNQYTLKEAIDIFVKVFHVPKEVKRVIQEAITAVYQKMASMSLNVMPFLK